MRAAAILGIVLVGTPCPSGPTDIERDVLSARARWERGEFRVRTTYVSDVGTSKEETHKTTRYVLFDGDRREGGRSRDPRSLNRGLPEAFLVDGRLHRVGFVYRLSGGQALRQATRLTITDFDALSGYSGESSYVPLEPRTLGLDPEGIQSHLGVTRRDEFVGNPDRTHTVERNEEFEGTPCKFIEYERSSFPLVVRMWIDPAAGPSVRRIQTECRTQHDEKQVYTSTSELVRHDASGLYYPKSIVVEEVVEDELRNRSTIDVAVTSLNGPLPADAFSISSFGLPTGAAVVTSPRDPRGELVWDGARIVPRRRPVPAIAAAVAPAPKTHAIPAALVAAVVLVATLVLYGVWQASRPA